MGTEDRRISLFLLLIASAVGEVSSARPAGATPSSRSYQAAPQRIAAFEPPVGWDRAATPPSPRLLATWGHRDGGRLTLVAEPVAAGVDSAHLFDQSRTSLERQGWAIGAVDRAIKPTGPGNSRVLVEATLDQGRRVARQLYVVEDGYAYVLTMVSPHEQQALRARDFDAAVASLKLGESLKR